MKVVGVLYIAVFLWLTCAMYDKYWPLWMAAGASFALTFVIFYTLSVPIAVLWGLYKAFGNKDKDDK